MSTVFLVTMTQAGNTVFRFAAAVESRANFLAGCCADRLADYHGLEFDYRVESIPHVADDATDFEIVKAALESAV